MHFIATRNDNVDAWKCTALVYDYQSASFNHVSSNVSNWVSHHQCLILCFATGSIFWRSEVGGVGCIAYKHTIQAEDFDLGW